MVDRWSVMVGGKKDSLPLLLSLLRSARNSDRWFPPREGNATAKRWFLPQIELIKQIFSFFLHIDRK